MKPASSGQRLWECQMSNGVSHSQQTIAISNWESWIAWYNKKFDTSTRWPRSEEHDSAWQLQVVANNEELLFCHMMSHSHFFSRWLTCVFLFMWTWSTYVQSMIQHFCRVDRPSLHITYFMTNNGRLWPERLPAGQSVTAENRVVVHTPWFPSFLGTFLRHQEPRSLEFSRYPALWIMMDAWEHMFPRANRLWLWAQICSLAHGASMMAQSLTLVL